MAASLLRRNRRESVLLGLLLAVVVAVVLAALAGARRTDAAIGQFVAADKGADGYAAFALPAMGGTAAPDLVPQEAKVRAVDGVVRTGRFTDVIVQIAGPSVPDGRLALQGDIGMAPGALDMIGRFHLVAGRPLDQSKVGEVLIDEELSRDAALTVGSHVQMRAYTSAQLQDGASAPAEGSRPRPRWWASCAGRPISAITQARQLVPNDYVVHQDIYLTAAFWHAAGGDIAGFNPVVAFDVAPGVDLRSVLTTLTKETAPTPSTPGRFLELDGTSRASIAAPRCIREASRSSPRSRPRRAVPRRADPGSPDRHRVVRRRHLARPWHDAAPAGRGGRAAGGRRSPSAAPCSAPSAPSRCRRLRRFRAPSPGEPSCTRASTIDLTVLLIGALVAAVLTMLVGALPSARAVGIGRASGGRPHVASQPRRPEASRAPAVVGVRFALEPGRGRTAVPVRTAIAAAAGAVALVVAAVTSRTR